MISSDELDIACTACSVFQAAIAAKYQVHAIKEYRVSLQNLPYSLPRIPCLDHEAMLHENTNRHISLYISDPDTKEIYELGYEPARKRVVFDAVSTSYLCTEQGQEKLISYVQTLEHVDQIHIVRHSWLKGDLRVQKACDAQVSLSEVIHTNDFSEAKRKIERLKTIATLMEKESRVASWSVRTLSGPFLAATGVFVVWLFGHWFEVWFEHETSQFALKVLQTTVVVVLGAIFLYLGLKAVHLTQMANRVWKRATEYDLILSERLRRKEN